jgi:hypothetical protein
MIVSREQILDNVWDINFDMNTNVVDVYINYLRKKVDKPFAQKINSYHKRIGLRYKIIMNIRKKLSRTLLSTFSTLLLCVLVFIMFRKKQSIPFPKAT